MRTASMHGDLVLVQLNLYALSTLFLIVVLEFLRWFAPSLRAILFFLALMF